MNVSQLKAKGTKRERYELVLEQIDRILTGESDPILWMATVVCLLKQGLDFFWVGFYRSRGGELVVGPYQGTLGCLRIPISRGVCGACARQQSTLIVPDVHSFPGHIACDSASRSEIVVPVFDGDGCLKAVLDIDSTQTGAFDKSDALFLEQIADYMQRSVQWNEAN